MTPLAPARATGRRESIVSCAVGDEQYALRGGEAWEIVRAERMRRAPGADGSVGTLSVAGETVPVFSLAAVLGRPPASEPRVRGDGNHVVVTRGPAGAIGWLVDRIVRSALPEDALLMALPDVVGSAATRWLDGVLRLEDRSLPLLAPGRLDPRVASDAPGVGHRASTFAPSPAATAPEDGRSPLVVIFSSPALPHAGVARLALSGRRVAAITRALPFLAIPGSARHVAGVMIWRDAVVPVVDVRRQGRPAAANDDRFLIARCGPVTNGTLVAFAVTAQVSLHAPTRADRLVEDLKESAPGFVTGVFSVGGERVALLDLDALLAGVSGPEPRVEDRVAPPPAAGGGERRDGPGAAASN